MILVFDTETSDVPNFGAPLDGEGQPHIVELGAVVLDRELNEIASISSLIQPDGWAISPKAQEVHGITLQMCSRHGIPLKAALIAFVSMLDTCRMVVAHNLKFDAFMIRSEMARLRAQSPGMDRARLRHVCTMKIGGSMARDGKYQTLPTLHEHLTGRAYAEKHRALADAQACARVARVMIEEGLIEI